MAETETTPTTESTISQNTLQENKLKLWDIIHDINYAMLLTVDHKDGCLRGRLMTALQNGFDEAGCLWFFTKGDTPKIEEIQREAKCNVVYSDTAKGIYVSICGTADILDDHEKVYELWDPFLKQYFPEGPGDPSLRLLKINVHKAEYWDVYSTTQSTPRMIYQTLKSAILGYPDGDLSVSEKLNISS